MTRKRFLCSTSNGRRSRAAAIAPECVRYPAAVHQHRTGLLPRCLAGRATGADPGMFDGFPAPMRRLDRLFRNMHWKKRDTIPVDHRMVDNERRLQRIPARVGESANGGLGELRQPPCVHAPARPALKKSFPGQAPPPMGTRAPSPALCRRAPGPARAPRAAARRGAAQSTRRAGAQPAGAWSAAGCWRSPRRPASHPK